MAALSAAAAPPDFVREVQPLLERHCLKCHGPEKQKGGLRFDSREGAFKTADSGERAIIPRQSRESRLIKLVSSADADERMPAKSEPLSPAQIDLLRRWIDSGANWGPNTAGTVERSELVVTDEDRKHWSYGPVGRPIRPGVNDNGWGRNPIDRFIWANLEQNKLRPTAQAEPRKLVRRIYFDLLGLPPTPEQITAFLKAYAYNAHGAVAGLVDELLASPHYGERWARHWLDVARYADSNGQEGDQDRPTAYHYRDFVIRALNADLPYDTFVRWQLAGDELEPDNPLAIAATGFIVAGPHTVLDVPMEEEKIRNRHNELDDMIATTGVAMLGLTLGCARCHDHKYDAIPTRDYYRLMCAFNGGNRAEVPLAPLDKVRRQREVESQWREELDGAKKRLDELLKELRQAHERKIEDKELRSLVSDEQRAEWEAREKAVRHLEGRKPKPLPTAHAFADFAAKPRDTWLLHRGDFKVRKEPVELGFLTVLMRGKTPRDYWSAAQVAPQREDSTQQRRALAEWIVDLQHGAGPLAARVIVNRLWQHHFGEGLVRTVNDFGVQGEAPSHPELLEWLASELVKGGWKLKSMHRLMMTSSVYLQDTTFDPINAQVDPENRLLWRRRPHRIESEILRDAMLAVSGTMNPEMFGRAFKAPVAAEAIQARNVKDPYPKDIKDNPSTWRRTVYMFHKRVVPYPLMQAFDRPDAQGSCGRRESTTVAPQALALLNDGFVRARAVDFAALLRKEAGDGLQAQIRRAWLLALGREPSQTEIEAAIGFIRGQSDQRSARGESERLALVDFCQAIFAMNEFIYVD
jgi:hypothetical protein